jgi:hypothetical protein
MASKPETPFFVAPTKYILTYSLRDSGAGVAKLEFALRQISLNGQNPWV